MTCRTALGMKDSRKMATIHYFKTVYGVVYFSDGSRVPDSVAFRAHVRGLRDIGYSVIRLRLEDPDDMEIIRLIFGYPPDMMPEDLNNKTV